MDVEKDDLKPSLNLNKFILYIFTFASKGFLNGPTEVIINGAISRECQL